MENGFVLLTVKETMWAEMLLDVLKDNHIPCASLPAHGGAGLAIRTGMHARHRIYVAEEYLPQAKDLMDILFSEVAILEEDLPE
jgi:hypothetical protein